ncbi:hypothetical protein ABIE66_000653 [Peribacillus sp. B2I2]
MIINNRKFYFQLLSILSLFILLISSANLSKVTADSEEDSNVELEGANVETNSGHSVQLNKR